MKDDTIERVRQETADWQYMRELPDDWHGFQLDRTVTVGKDMYIMYQYSNDALHKSAMVYFHEETNEYKVCLKVGLIEFCRIEFITPSLTVFEDFLRRQFEQVLLDMVVFNPKTLGSIVLDKGITTWESGAGLPEELEGFSLYIHPQEPVKINNGSYIIIDYVDFSLESSFTVYYNIYRDEFFAEARIWNIPDVNYDFDSNELTELEIKLRERLRPRLQQVRGWAEQQAATQQKQAEKETRNA